MPTQKNNNNGALPKLKAFASGDGAHCGLTDWYPKKERALKRALKRQQPFDTGWYGSKKEIASARVYSTDGKTVLVEVSVSDDLDTGGLGSAMAMRGAVPVNICSVQEAIHRAWAEANENQKDNRLYYGFAIRRNILTSYTDYSKTPPKEKKRIWKQAWIETLILPRGDGGMMNEPPGDNYHVWGFQGESIVPKKHREALEAWANKFIAGQTKDKSFTSGKWTIEPWADDQVQD
jgi:hypothetical protein